MKIAVHRILFGVASFFMLVSVIQFLLWLNRYEYPIDGQVLFIMLGFFHVALLVLPIFLYRVRIIGLLSLVLLFLSQFLYHILIHLHYKQIDNTSCEEFLYFLHV